MAKSSALVGGVSSNFRINPYTGSRMYLEKADGCRIHTTDGREYIDFFMGHGANLLGHNVPEIRKAVEKVFDRGFYAEFDSEDNLHLAELVAKYIPAAEAVRYTNSGTEATLLIFRLLRAYTKRKLVIRIDGHFHGATDYSIPNWLWRHIDASNPGGTTSKMEQVAGVPEDIANTIRLIPWNDIPALKKVIAEEGPNIAGMIMNPIDFNNGCVTTTSEYLKEVKEILHANGSVMVLDEILAGFKTGISCAQGYYGVTPDLCSLSKAFSNGVPISAVAGKREIMEIVMNKEREVVAGGTFSGNQIGVQAAITSLDMMSREGFYDRLLGNAEYFFAEIERIFKAKQFPAVIQHVGAMFGLYFGTTDPVTNYKQFPNLDWELGKSFYRKVIEKGLYFHTDFTVSAAHERKDLDRALEVIDSTVDELS
jgi:glutamate-1-semialdehyde 2,1-aminomutase